MPLPPSIEPLASSSISNQVEVAQAVSNFGERLGSLEKAIQLHPDKVLADLISLEAAYDACIDKEQRMRYCKLRGQAHCGENAYEKAEHWAREGLRWAEAIGHLLGKVSLHNILGIIASNCGDFAEAIYQQSLALEIARAQGFHAAVGHLASNLGLDYTYIGDVEQALDFYHISLEAWEKENEPIGRGNARLNIGFAQSQLRRFKESIVYYNLAEEDFQSVDYVRGLIIVWRNRASALLELGDLKMARPLAQRACQAARRSGDIRRLAIAVEGLAEFHRRCGHYHLSRLFLRKCKRLHARAQNRRGVVIALQHEADLPDCPPDEALKLLAEAKTLAEVANLKPEIVTNLRLRTDVFKKLGNWQAACEALEEHHRLERAIFTERADLRARMTQLSHDYERARQEAEIEKLRNVELACALEEAEKLRKTADEANRQKTEILHIAAHDLRNHSGSVLASGRMAAEFARSERTSVDLRDMIENLCYAGNLLHETLEHILDASAVETGNLTIEPSRFDLVELAQSLAGYWADRAEEKHQRLFFRPPLGGEAPVCADPLRTREILENLLSNALKYGPIGSTIKMQVLLPPNGMNVVRCSVEDEGPGIPEKEQHRLFQPFQKLSPRPTGKESSIGLGLYITQKLAQLQGGRVFYERRSEGGSRFYLELPLVG